MQSWIRASLMAQWWRLCLPMQETQVQSLSQEDPLEKDMTTHSSILAWKIPWAEKPGGLQCMGLLGLGHEWAQHTHTQSFPVTFAQASLSFQNIFLPVKLVFLSLQTWIKGISPPLGSFFQGYSGKATVSLLSPFGDTLRMLCFGLRVTGGLIPLLRFHPFWG